MRVERLRWKEGGEEEGGGQIVEEDGGVEEGDRREFFLRQSDSFSVSSIIR